MRLWQLALAGVGIAGLMAHSVAVRHDCDRTAAAVAEVSPGDRLDPPTGRILLDLADDIDPARRAAIAARLDEAVAPYEWPDGELGDELSDPAELYRFAVPPSEIDDVLAMLGGLPEVEALELEREWSLPETAESVRLSEQDLVGADDAEPARGRFTPNDPYYRHQWHLDQIQMPAAWTRNRGDGVVVAVVDTGVLFRSSGRFRQAPDLKDTRFVDGYDFVDDDGVPNDEHGHGTHVAGTIAQSTNNGVGVAGVAPGASIMPIRVLDRRGAGSWGGVAAGIRWAVDHGAKVINLSLGGSIPSNAIRNAIAHAHRNNVVVVAAAGNTGRGRVEYPAAHAHAVAVGAVRFDEQLSFYSSWGSALDVVAPGGDLRVDQNEDGLPDGVLQNTMVRGNPGRHDYLAFQGTSMAAPHVAGVAALLVAAGIEDADAVEAILKRTAKAKQDRRRYGAGLVQADAALQAATQGTGGARGLTGVFFALLGFWTLRRSRKALVGRSAVLVWSAAFAGGLAVLPLHWLGIESSWLSFGALPEAVQPLVASILLPILVVGVFYGNRRMRPLLVGLSFGLAAWLTLEAVFPTQVFGWVPALLTGPLMLVQALAAAFLGRQLLVRGSERSVHS